MVYKFVALRSNQTAPMCMTTEELTSQIRSDRQLLNVPFQLRELSGMARGNWIVAAGRQRGKSCALAQLIYQRTRQREDRRLYGVEPIVLSLRQEIYRCTTACQLSEALVPLIAQGRVLLCLDDVDLLVDWPELLVKVVAPNIEIIATMSEYSVRQIAEDGELRERFAIRYLADLTLHEYLRMSKPKYSDALNDFVRWGGYPGVLLYPKDRSECQQRLFRTLFYEELLPLVRNEAALRMILHLLAEHLGEEVSYNGVCQLLQKRGIKVGVTTVAEYITMLERERLICSIKCYSAQNTRLPKQRYWFVDNGLLSLFLPSSQMQEQLLRNTMAQVVVREYRNVVIYYASQRNASVDFYIPERGIAIMLCAQEGTVPEAVRNLQRFGRQHSVLHKYIYTVGKISDLLPRGIFNRYLPEWRSL